MDKILSVFDCIVKRDGKQEKFNSKKIQQAILKAGTATGEFGEQISLNLTVKVLSIAQETLKNTKPTVEQIQDIVEEVLLNSPYKASAKAFIIYRDQHSKMREVISKFNVDLVDNYLSKADWQVKENSNMSYSLQGLNNYISSEVSKVYWLNKIYTDDIKKAIYFLNQPEYKDSTVWEVLTDIIKNSSDKEKI